MKVKVFDTKSAKGGELTLPAQFSEKENMPLLAQALRVYEWGKHPGTHKVKTRAEVTISTRKIYRQKHTGNARHGAKSAPIFVGGGIAHGPQGIKKTLSMPQNMRVNALKVALSLKAKNNQVVVLSEIDKIAKSKNAYTLLTKVAKSEFEGKMPVNMTLYLSEKNIGIMKFFRNIENLKVLAYKNINAYDVFLGGLILIDQEVFSKAKKSEAKTKK